MQDNNLNISKRLAEFGQSLFGNERGWKSQFARALQLTPGGLEMYLTGQRIPGHVMHSNLRALNCDIEWLMTGKSNTPGGRIAEPLAGYDLLAGIPDGPKKKKIRKMIEELKKLDEDEVERAVEIVRTAFKKK